MDAMAYLKKNIDDRVAMKAWKDKSVLPVFLRDAYHIYEMTILDTTCLLIRSQDKLPVMDALEKQINRIEEATNQKVVLYEKEITQYRRKRLFEKRIPFIIGDGQVFLPFLGLHLKKTSATVKEVVTSFSPSAQMAYLFFLYNKESVVNTTQLAQKLGFTPMTASRALNDLYDAKLIRYDTGGKTGRSKEYWRIPDPAYFKRGVAYVKSPVKKVIYSKTLPRDASIAGLEALAALSMINSPDHPVRAISSKELKSLDTETTKDLDLAKDQKYKEVEIWEYDPKGFTDNQYVDRMSLYASLMEEKDERIQLALEEIIRGETWYTD